jgi:hypothetical protein
MRHSEAGKPRLGRFPQEDVMPYGNYWIAEGVYREMSDDWSALSLRGSWFCEFSAGMPRRDIHERQSCSGISSKAV